MSSTFPRPVDAREAQIQRDGRDLVRAVLYDDQTGVGDIIFGGFYTDAPAMAELFQAAADYTEHLDKITPRPRQAAERPLASFIEAPVGLSIEVPDHLVIRSAPQPQP